MKPTIGQESWFFAYHSCIWRPRWEYPSEYCHNVWYRETRTVWLPDGGKKWRCIRSFVYLLFTTIIPWSDNTCIMTSKSNIRRTSFFFANKLLFAVSWDIVVRYAWQDISNINWGYEGYSILLLRRYTRRLYNQGKRNVSYKPKTKTVACDSCSDVVEVVITNSSPGTVVVDFQTSGTLTTASQSHRH